MEVAVVPKGRAAWWVVRVVGVLAERRAQVRKERGLPRRAATTIEAMRRRASRMAVKRRGSMLS